MPSLPLTNLTCYHFAGSVAYAVVFWRCRDENGLQNGSLHTIFNVRAKYGKQLPEKIYSEVKASAMNYARMHPEVNVQYTRYDFEYIVGLNRHNMPQKVGDPPKPTNFDYLDEEPPTIRERILDKLGVSFRWVVSGLFGLLHLPRKK